MSRKGSGKIEPIVLLQNHFGNVFQTNMMEHHLCLMKQIFGDQGPGPAWFLKTFPGDSNACRRLRTTQEMSQVL
jgi:hypothetical protein